MEKKPTILLVVAAALISESREILVQQRPQGSSMAGLWEFPGGKVEQWETPETALIRELSEELDLTVDQDQLSPIAFASERLEDKHLVLLLYLCQEWQGEPKNLVASAMQWLPLVELRDLRMPPADKPLVDQLLAMEVG